MGDGGRHGAAADRGRGLIARPEPRAASSLSELGALLDPAAIDGALAGISAAAKGELGWPPPALFHGLLAATWHDLSDVARRGAGRPRQLPPVLRLRRPPIRNRICGTEGVRYGARGVQASGSV
jgi:hypothetical protein